MGSALAIQRSWFELGHPPPFSAEVMNEWSYTCTPPVCLHGVDRGSFNLTRWPLVINTYESNFLLRRHFQGHACSCVSTTVGQLPVIVVGNVASIVHPLFRFPGRTIFWYQAGYVFSMCSLYSAHWNKPVGYGWFSSAYWTVLLRTDLRTALFWVLTQRNNGTW
jgi:hypothetical protein